MVMADRLPVALLGTVWWTVVLGDRAAVPAVTKRPGGRYVQLT
jgi:hypothetical protein